MPPVTIYTRDWCPYCSAAKQLLQKMGVSFQEIDIGHTPSERAVMVERAGGRTSVPQVFIGAEHVGGSDELHALERSGALDLKLAATAHAGAPE